LDIDSDEILKKFDIDIEKYDEILDVIHSFEPFGVCSRNLKECLMIQVQVRGIKNDIVKEIIENYLDDVGNNRLSQISKSIGCTIEEIKEALHVIRDLEPKPGRIFSSARDIRYITPDVIVKKIEGEYVIIVSDSTAPKLKINSFYNKMVSNGEISGSASDYINKKLISAFKLIKSIEQRRNTIYKVVKAIIEFQEDFFEKGTVHLKTLILKDVADQIGVHESTVSRAINGKYMQCPRGLFEIKYFFQSGVSSIHGDGVSAESIKTIIKEIIDNEDSHKPISDQNISDELNKLGIKISRRTVAKYRDEIGILSTSKRKIY
jgi:RNA polymerase sigma-54 factor